MQSELFELLQAWQQDPIGTRIVYISIGTPYNKNEVMITCCEMKTSTMKVILNASDLEVFDREIKAKLG